MTAKQLKASNAETSTQENVQITSDVGGRNRNLFIRVDTFNTEGRDVGNRIVDLYHFGTRNWLQNHHWWAMHNGHTVETKTADPAEVDAYLSEQKLALAAKFNTELAHTAA